MRRPVHPYASHRDRAEGQLCAEFPTKRLGDSFPASPGSAPGSALKPSYLRAAFVRSIVRALTLLIGLAWSCHWLEHFVDDPCDKRYGSC
jgi:hypothetical protein